MNWRTVLTVSLLAAAVVTGVAVLRQSARLRATGPAEVRPDYVLHDFSIVTLDAQGQEGFTLNGPLLERNPDDHTMTLATPTFLFPDKHGRNWRAVSKTAWVSAKGDEVRLRGAVLLDSPDGTSNARLSTEQMDVFPNANRATSTAQVTVTQPGTIIRGRGLEALMDQERITLLADVKAQYDPSSAR